MKTLIATCGPYGNFQEVLAILHQAGLEKESDAFIRWHDNVFGPLGNGEPPPIDRQLLERSKIEENITMISAKAPNSNQLLADSRCLWALDVWAEKLPEAKFLLFYSNAETALAYACQHTIEPQHAQDSWQSAIHQLLKFQRCNRRRSVLLDTEAAIRRPQALLNICQKIGITLHSLPPNTTRIPDQPILERYLAQNLVANQPQVQALQAELDASAHPLDDTRPLKVQPHELFKKQSQQLTQQHKLQYQLEETLKKLQIAEHMLNEQNTVKIQLQTQLDQMTQARDDQVELITQQRTKLQEVQQAYQKLERNQETVAQENELLLLQLHQVQEELEKTFLQKCQLEQKTHQHLLVANNKSTKELQRVKKELLDKEREIERLHQRETNLKHTVSWRITAPIRAIIKPFYKLSKERIKIKEQIKLLRTSGLFDEEWYAAVNEDVVKDGYDPVEHYLLYGAAEGRNPSSVFNTRNYLEINPDVAEAGLNPLVHYAKYGIAEKRGIGSARNRREYGA